MTVEITFHIGQDEDESGKPLERTRAFFYWEHEDGTTSVNYSKDELAAEIERLRSAGKDTAIFEEALHRLLGR